MLISSAAIAEVKSAKLFVVTEFVLDPGFLLFLADDGLAVLDVACREDELFADFDFTFGRKSDINDPVAPEGVFDAVGLEDVAGDACPLLPRDDWVVVGPLDTPSPPASCLLFRARPELPLLSFLSVLVTDESLRELKDAINSNAAGESPSRFFRCSALASLERLAE